MILRYTNYLMALLFGISAIAQFNDPDPYFWVLIYGAGSIISILYAVNKLPWMVAALLALISGIWALTITPELTTSGFRYIFDEIQMRAIGVEAAREFSGLLIVTLWSVLLAVSIGKKKEVT